MSPGELALRAQDLLSRLREEPRVPEEREQLLIAMNALRFLAASGQLQDFAAYR
ncbi:hypothetical protein [Melittangium boletus]|uniref:hypothetical protein n=1 Tax=Melittangium boletus TaxID=83453 RepID=UPI003DA2B206